MNAPVPPATVPGLPGTPHRFEALDGLRGLAAIAVMLFHYGEHNGLHWLPSAWVAVDLFFVLSGFVIAHSYAARLRAGMSLGDFMAVRWLRLGPLYLVGLALGAAALAVTMSLGRAGHVTAPEALSAAGLDLLWLPYLNHVAWPFGGEVVRGPVFPLNIPAWSLFFEAIVNLLFVAHVKRFGRSAGVALVAVSGVVFIAITLRLGVINPGWSGGTLVYGFPRVIFEFFLGALIFELKLHERRIGPWLTGLAATTLFASFLSTNVKAALLDAWFVVPLAVIAVAGLRVRGPARGLCHWLGDISYPLYIVHYPLFQLAYELFRLREVDPKLQVASVSLLAIAIAWLLVGADRRVRVWLLKRRALAAPAMA